MEEIVVSLGEVAIGYEGDILISLGLGSCVAVVLYDPTSKIGGLAHVMLPESKEFTMNMPQKRVMIADKDSNTRDNIKTILSNHDYEVIGEASRKNEVLENFKKLMPSVSLISAFLPPTDGIDVINNILSLDKDANTIILSPEIEKEGIFHYMEKGAKEVIQNPFTEEKVVSSVEFVVYNKLLKFADKALPLMLKRMINNGAKKEKIIAKIVGGAHMFTSIQDETIMNIGNRNVESIKSKLKDMNIKIVSEETGSNVGRSIRFFTDSGKLKVKTKDEQKEI